MESLITYKSHFLPNINIHIVFEDNENYQELKPFFDDYGFGFYFPEFKTIIINGEVFINNDDMNMDDLRFVEAHEISHLVLNHNNGRSEDDEIDADLGAYLLLRKNGYSTERLIDTFLERHGIEFNENLLKRVNQYPYFKNY